MLEASTEFRKNGFNDEDAAQLGQIAAMFQNVADEEISAGNAASFIIAQMTAFDIEAENASKIIDSVNEVANRFSVSSADISNNLGKMSAVMSQTGASFEQGLAMLTAITEVTRSASKASRGLVSIGSRLIEVLNENSSTGNNLRKIYEELGIQLFDTEGQLRSSYDIFYDLAQIWDTLDRNTQNYISTEQAGTTQFQNFAALMKNFSTAVEATDVAMQSAGSAARENSKYMEGLEAKTNAVKASFEKLSNAVIDSGLVKGILDLSKGFLDLAGTSMGTFITQTTLLTALMFGGTGLLHAMKIVPALLNGITLGTTALGTAIKVTVPELMLVATAIAGIVAIAPSVSDWFKRLTDVTYDAEVKTQKLNQELQTNQERLEELNKIPEVNRTNSIEKEIRALQEQNKELRENIALQNERVALANFEDFTGEEALSHPGFYASSEMSGIIGRYGEDFTSSAKKGLAQQYYKSILQKLKNVQGQISKEGSTSETVSLLNQYTASLSAMAQMAEKVKAEDLPNWAKEVLNEFNGLSSKTAELTKEIYSAEDSLSLLNNGFAINDLQLAQLEKRFPGISSSLERTEQGFISNTDSLDEFLAKLGETNEEIRKASSIYNQLSKGLGITEEQYKQLIELVPELNSALALNNDAYYLNAQGLVELAKTGNDWAIAMISSQNSATKVAIEGAKKRIDAIKQEIVTQEELKLKYQQKHKGTAQGHHTEAIDNIISILKNQLSNEYSELDKIYDEFTGFYEESGGLITATKPSLGGNGGTNSSADPALEVFRTAHQALQHKLNMDLISQEQYYNELEKIVEEYKNSANAKQEEMYRYEEEIYAGRKKLAEELAKKKEEEANNEIDFYKMFFNAVANKAQEEIDILQKQKDSIREQNEELEKQLQIEEALNNLAKAKQKQVLVYKNGRMQYVSDVDAVSEAQRAVDEAKKQGETDKQLDDIDKQIQAWEEYKKAWGSVVGDYDKLQDNLLIKQKLGVDLESKNWQTRLKNLQYYVNQYNGLMSQVGGMGNLVARTHSLPTTPMLMSNGYAINQPLAGWSGVSPASTMSAISGGVQSFGQSIGISIQNFNPSLPNVTDGEGFVNYLRTSFLGQTLQFAKT